MRVLHAVTRAPPSSRTCSLVTGLGGPETFHVEVAGDGAVVTIPGGHMVKLKREGGVWRVDDFDWSELHALHATEHHLRRHVGLLRLDDGEVRRTPKRR